MPIMIKKKYLSDGTVSSRAVNIENHVIDNFQLNIEINDDDLEVVKINLFDEDILLMDINYLIRKDTFQKLNLKKCYDIRNENEEAEIMPLLNSITNGIDMEIIDKYSYMNKIHNTWSEYLKVSVG